MDLHPSGAKISSALATRLFLERIRFEGVGAEVDFKLTLLAVVYKSFPTSVVIVNLTKKGVLKKCSCLIVLIVNLMPRNEKASVIFASSNSTNFLLTELESGTSQYGPSAERSI